MALLFLPHPDAASPGSGFGVEKIVLEAKVETPVDAGKARFEKQAVEKSSIRQVNIGEHAVVSVARLVTEAESDSLSASVFDVERSGATGSAAQCVG